MRGLKNYKKRELREKERKKKEKIPIREIRQNFTFIGCPEIEAGELLLYTGEEAANVSL